MTCTSDALGRSWSHEKLDQLLADPAVGLVIREAEQIGHDPQSGFCFRLVEAWAERQGRSRAGIALLFLCWRSACCRREEPPA